MAITPSAAKTYLADADMNEIARLEEEIDAYLKCNFFGHPVHVTCIPVGTSARVCNNVLGRYRNAGWTISEGEVGHGRHCYEFKEKSASSGYWDR